MRNLFIIFFILILICVIFKSCPYRVNCDRSNNVKLGQVDYSDRFKECDIHRFQDTLVFKNSSEVLTFIRNTDLSNTPSQLQAYRICEKVDIEPYTAYAYYEYENLHSQFKSDSGGLNIHPVMKNNNNKREESLYLNFYTKFGSLKGRVPISNVDTSRTYRPYGELFKYNESINLNAKLFEKIWVFKKDEMGIYYSMDLGLVGVEYNNKIFIRNN